MNYLLWSMGGLLTWLAFGFCWCRWIAGPDEDEKS